MPRWLPRVLITLQCQKASLRKVSTTLCISVMQTSNWETAPLLNLRDITYIKSAVIPWRRACLARKHTWSKISLGDKRQSESINVPLLRLRLIIHFLNSNKVSSFSCSVSTLQHCAISPQYCVISLTLKPLHSFKYMYLNSEPLKLFWRNIFSSLVALLVHHENHWYNQQQTVTWINFYWKWSENDASVCTRF